MPEISRFFGIVIKMYYNDHAPPHFHAEYGDHVIEIDIATLEIRHAERFSRRAMALVLEWAALHRGELIEDWNLARAAAPLKKIQPLE